MRRRKRGTERERKREKEGRWRWSELKGGTGCDGVDGCATDTRSSQTVVADHGGIYRMRMRKYGA